jgi:hypothetical protein
MRVQELPHDLRATLSLMLSRGKGYGEIAGLLQIERRAVHDRAHAALALLAPRQARELSAAQRELVGEYLLGQADSAQSAQAHAYLRGSAHARAWAGALLDELAPLSAAQLPPIPGPEATAELAPANGATPADSTPDAPPADSTSDATPADSTPGAPPVDNTSDTPPVDNTSDATPADSTSDAPPADGVPLATLGTLGSPSSTPSSSRRGGAILLGGLVAVGIAATALVVSLGGASSPSSGSTTTHGVQKGSTPSTAPTGTTQPAAAGKSGGSGKVGHSPHLDATLTLTPTSSSSRALGLVEVISSGNEHGFLMAAEHLPPTHGFHYAAWLYNTPSDASFLGAGPTVGSNGVLKAIGGLPADAGRYATIVLTEETEERPKHPGPIVLSGPFKLS